VFLAIQIRDEKNLFFLLCKSANILSIIEFPTL